MHDLELLFANKRATSLPGDDETEYSVPIKEPVICVNYQKGTNSQCMTSIKIDRGFE